jgi:hypothetical protein
VEEVVPVHAHRGQLVVVVQVQQAGGQVMAAVVVALGGPGMLRLGTRAGAAEAMVVVAQLRSRLQPALEQQAGVQEEGC